MRAYRPGYVRIIDRRTARHLRQPDPDRLCSAASRRRVSACLGIRQTSDLEGGAGTPLQVWMARPVTWRMYLGVIQSHVDITSKPFCSHSCMFLQKRLTYNCMYAPRSGTEANDFRSPPPLLPLLGHRARHEAAARGLTAATGLPANHGSHIRAHALTFGKQENGLASTDALYCYPIENAFGISSPCQQTVRERSAIVVPIRLGHGRQCISGAHTPRRPGKALESASF